ncbi:hypothetical protein [Jidongwangia harbinensis]|uniref:hypothetical protein n=1 Tax=Jidongwangia harbinensis TaxID=2878561 RepID=UPI001CD984DF|nr:hypothetical protein [Jidongwangia harbinensis]MCA2214435.1 hypothetical protein [Jidongwangia harbinensis]
MAVAAVVGVAQVAVSPAPAAAYTPLSAVATSTADEIWHRAGEYRYKWLCDVVGADGVASFYWDRWSCEQSGSWWVLWVQD